MEGVGGQSSEWDPWHHYLTLHPARPGCGGCHWAALAPRAWPLGSLSGPSGPCGQWIKLRPVTLIQHPTDIRESLACASTVGDPEEQQTGSTHGNELGCLPSFQVLCRALQRLMWPLPVNCGRLASVWCLPERSQEAQGGGAVRSHLGGLGWSMEEALFGLRWKEEIGEQVRVEESQAEEG